MQYEIESKNDRIKALAKFLVENLQSNFEDYVILLESGIACKILQDEISSYLSKLSINASFLPEILPINSQDDIKILKYFTNYIDNNEAEIILSKILIENNISKNISESLHLSRQLLSLYQKFEFNEINIQVLDDLYSDNLPEHSYKNIDIIKRIFTLYKKYKDDLNKYDYISILKKNELYKSKKIILGFLEEKNQIPNSYINNILSNKGIYFPKLYSKETIVSLKKIQNNIIICELDNEFQEAIHITKYCYANKNSKILILSENLLLNQLLEINFKKYGIDYSNYVYKKNLDQFLELYINILSFLNDKFDLKKLILILKSPLLINKNIHEIEYKILRNQKNFKNIELLIEEINNLCSEETSKFFKNFYKILQIYNKNCKASHIEIAKNLALFCSINFEDYSKYFENIYNFNKYFKEIKNDEYIYYLNYTANNFFDQTKNPTSKISICKISDFYIFSDIDAYVIPSFTETYWPEKNQDNQLLPNFMLDKLGMLNNVNEIQMKILAEIINKNKTYISFASKYSCESINRSKYLGIFESIKNNKLIQFEKLSYSSNDLIKKNHDDEYISFDSSLMPKKISATSIEMLIRNPYGFYVKYILHLRKLPSLIPDNNFAEFGSFIHKIFEEYTKLYNEKDHNRYERIITISKSVFEEMNSCSNIPISWLYKFEKIARSYIDFDQKRRKNIKYIFVEKYGKIDLNIGNKIITISAIADRIEVDKDGYVYILDYKTGTLPSSKSVNQGINPQLILESIIAKNNGYQGLGTNKIKKIIFIKISVTAPHIIEQEIDISEDVLLSHYDGLKKILSYYYNQDKITIKKIELDISPEYNDYLHMMRNSK